MEYNVHILWNIVCIFYGIYCVYFMEYTVHIYGIYCTYFMEYTVHILWNILCIFYGIYCVYFMEYTVYILWNIHVLCIFYGIYTVYILWNILYKTVDLAVVIKFSVSYLNLSQSCSHLGCYWMLLILDFKGLINTLRPGEGWMYQWHESSFYFRLP